MTADQEKYLMKRLDNIYNKKKKEIIGKDYFENKTYSDTFTLEYIIKYLSEMKDPYSLKMKCKFDPKEIYDIITKYPLNAIKALTSIIDFSEIENKYKDDYDRVNNKLKELDNIKIKLVRNIILKNDCDDIIKMINDFSKLKI